MLERRPADKIVTFLGNLILFPLYLLTAAWQGGWGMAMGEWVYFNFAQPQNDG